MASFPVNEFSKQLNDLSLAEITKLLVRKVLDIPNDGSWSPSFGFLMDTESYTAQRDIYDISFLRYYTRVNAYESEVDYQITITDPGGETVSAHIRGNDKDNYAKIEKHFNSISRRFYEKQKERSTNFREWLEK